MVNQSIALQARVPVSSGGGNSFAQNMQIMNMMAQRTAAERMAQQAQQTMGIQAAQEGRAAALAKPALSDAEMKNTLGYMNYVYDTASKSPDIASARAKLEAIGADPRFQGDMFQRGLAEVVSTLPSDPAQYKPWQDTTLSKTLSAADRLKQHFVEQDLGATTRLFASPDLAGSGGGGQVVPGSTAAKTLSPANASEVTYLKGPNDSAITAPKYLPLAGSGGASAANLVGGERGGGGASALATNPGALKDGPFARAQPGYTGASGGFATFNTPAQGVSAQESLLTGNYINKGINTIDKIVNRYAPPGAENSPASVANYKQYIAQQTGIDPASPISAAQVPAVAKAMREFETGQRAGGAAPAATGGAGPFQLGKTVPGTGKATTEVGELPPKKKAELAHELQQAYNLVTNPSNSSFMTSDKNSYIANRTQELVHGTGNPATHEYGVHTWMPNGIEHKSMWDQIDKHISAAMIAGRLPGTASTDRALGAQLIHLRSLGGGANPSRETMQAALESAAQDKGINLRNNYPTTSGGGAPSAGWGKATRSGD